MRSLACLPTNLGTDTAAEAIEQVLARRREEPRRQSDAAPVAAHVGPQVAAVRDDAHALADRHSQSPSKATRKYPLFY